MKILVIGASARAAAQSSHRAGKEVAALDLFVDRDLAEIAECEAIRDFPGSILEQAERWPDHAILLCGGMENFPEIVSELESRHQIIGPNTRQIRELRSLANWREWGTSHADSDWIRFPETIEAESLSEQDSSRKLPSKHGGLGSKKTINWLCKSTRSAGGMQVFPLSDLDSEREPNTYAQQYIEGTVLGITFFCTPLESFVLGVVQNISIGESALDASPSSNAMPYLYAGSIGPFPLGSETESRLATWIGIIASSIQYQGILQADFVLGDDGALYLLEFNPRWTASMELIEMSCRTNLIDLQLRTQFSTNESVPIVRGSAASYKLQVQKRILYASQDTTISFETSNKMLERSNWWSKPQPGQGALVGWADIPHSGTSIAAGSPLATIWAIRPTNSMTIDTKQLSGKISAEERWREIDELLETLDGYPACIHAVFTRH